MKRFLCILWIVLSMVMLFGCSASKVEVTRTIDGNRKEYCELSDGTWKTKDKIYQYRLEISGRMGNAVKDSTFVYLSNLKEITFDRAWKAAGFSSNKEDYFLSDEAVLVEMY